jgi:TusA-related sulfurtransferase
MNVLDVRGLGCGSVLVRLAQYCRQLTEPEIVLIWTDDAGADDELPSWCRMTNNEFFELHETADESPRYKLRLHPKGQSNVQTGAITLT